jgi:hypothetical protein
MNRIRPLSELLQQRDAIQIEDFVDIPRLITHVQALERAIEQARAREAQKASDQPGFE